MLPLALQPAPSACPAGSAGPGERHAAWPPLPLNLQVRGTFPFSSLITRYIFCQNDYQYIHTPTSKINNRSRIAPHTQSLQREHRVGDDNSMSDCLKVPLQSGTDWERDRLGGKMRWAPSGRGMRSGQRGSHAYMYLCCTCDHDCT